MARKLENTKHLTKDGKGLSRVDIFNIYEQDVNGNRAEIVTADNLNIYASKLIADDKLLDAFGHNLMTKIIALDLKTAGKWDTPFKIFHKGEFFHGMGLEEQAFNLVPVKPNLYEDENGEQRNFVDDMFGRHKMESKVLIQTIDKEMVADITVYSRDKLAEAIMSDAGMDNFIGSMLTQLRNSTVWYQHKVIMSAVNDLVKHPDVYTEELTGDLNTEEGAKQFLVTAQGLIGRWKFFSREYNIQGVDMHSLGKKPVFMLSPEDAAKVKIMAKSAMFNMEEEVVSKYFLEVDGLPANTAVLSTTDLLSWYTKTNKVLTVTNVYGEWTNYRHKIQDLVSLNLFANAAVIKFNGEEAPEEPEVPQEPEEPGK